MIRLMVMYGHPKDPAAFDAYYRDVPNFATGGVSFVYSDVTQIV